MPKFRRSTTAEDSSVVDVFFPVVELFSNVAPLTCTLVKCEVLSYLIKVTSTYSMFNSLPCTVSSHEDWVRCFGKLHPYVICGCDIQCVTFQELFGKSYTSTPHFTVHRDQEIFFLLTGFWNIWAAEGLSPHFLNFSPIPVPCSFHTGCQYMPPIMQRCLTLHCPSRKPRVQGLVFLLVERD